MSAEVNERWTNGKPRIVTEKDLAARWGCGKPGERFRCGLCGYRFALGDYWRWVYLNDLSPSPGNGFVCEGCDGHDVRERFLAHYQQWRELTAGKFWSYV